MTMYLLYFADAHGRGGKGDSAERKDSMIERMSIRLQILFKYKDLIKQLVFKDIKLKYRRSFLGYVWSVLNPLMVMLVMYVVFSQMFRFDLPNYPAYLIIGQSLFTFMTEATNQSIGSIFNNASLLKKIYVPKYIFTMSKVMSSLVNLLFSLVAMGIVFVISGVKFTWMMLLVPFVMVELFIFCLGLSLFLASSSVFFRDIQYIYSVFTTAWLYLTPIFYPLSQLPAWLQSVVRICNPMCIYITHFRILCLEGRWPGTEDMLYGYLIAIFVLICGSYFFIRKQDDFILYI